jgi:hypothetical protein
MEVQPTGPAEQALARDNTAGSSSSGSGHDSGLGGDVRLSQLSDISNSHLATLRATAVSEGSLRLLMSGLFSKNSKGDERKTIPLWSRDDVSHFQTVAGDIRGRIVSQKLQLFNRCGLNIADFQRARRTQLIITED